MTTTSLKTRYTQGLKYLVLAVCILLLGSIATIAADKRIRSATQMRQCTRLLNVDKVVPMPQRTK